MSRTNTVIAAIGMNEDCSVWMERKKLRMMHYRDLISFDELSELLENYMSCACVRKLLHENDFEIERSESKLREKDKFRRLDFTLWILQKYVYLDEKEKKKWKRNGTFPSFKGRKASGWPEESFFGTQALGLQEGYFRGTHPRRRERHQKEFEAYLEKAENWKKERDNIDNERKPIKQNGILVKHGTVVKLEKIGRRIKVFDEERNDYTKLFKSKARTRMYKKGQPLKAEISWTLTTENILKRPDMYLTAVPEWAIKERFSLERNIKWEEIKN